MSLDRSFLARLKGKSLKTVVFRGTQELDLARMALFGGWKRLSKRIEGHWRAKNVTRYVAGFENNGRRGVLTDPAAEEAMGEAFRHSLMDKEALLSWGAAIRARKFRIFHHDLPPAGGFPWRTDWRFGHEYKNADFRTFDHHAARSVPYDVKYPWEVSRLWFLPPLLQKAMLDKSLGWDQGHVEEVFAALSSFRALNPLAGSVNWHPMEVSMRGVALVLLLDMALFGKLDEDRIRLLLTMIAEHGEFLWRTVEYTDNRGNHYAANLTALLLMGAALHGHYKPALKWQFYAAEHIEEEIGLQFCADGVNFEKSASYHRLVTELFLLCRIVLSRQGIALGAEADRLLQEACHYAAALRRPDGLAPVIGDTDDAVVLALDSAPPRDFSSVLTLGAVIYEDPELKSALSGHYMHPAAVWIFGRQGVDTFRHLTPTALPPLRHFSIGGMMIVRDGDNMLVVDAGEVGQAGVGGHGHNDMLSFELVMGGHALLVDPGCPSYTGEPLQRKLFRSTGYHNSLVLDGAEIAEMTGPFRIANDALPVDAAAGEKNGVFTLAAGHTGYRRLPSPADHRRTFVFDPRAGSLQITDHLGVSGPHKADRYFHFAEGAELKQSGKSVIVTLFHMRFEVTFDDYSEPYLLSGRVSNGYGHTAEAPILMLSTQVVASVDLCCRIAKL